MLWFLKILIKYIIQYIVSKIILEKLHKLVCFWVDFVPSALFESNSLVEILGITFMSIE